jgi:8-oxo-dGTP pyrophosphatase MutT (NUDIX family)
MRDIAVPVPASTILLIRAGGGDGFEVLLTRRPANMKVLAGFLVFPGGCVEKEDSSDQMIARCRGLSPDAAQRILGDEIGVRMAVGHWVAAVRELFEEVGIHFFVTEKGSPGPTVSSGLRERLAENPATLSDVRLTLAALLESEKLFCDLGRLVYLFHRITPPHYPVRFDTRFYLAALPPDQVPCACSDEVAEVVWLSPREALRQSESGILPMMPPTLIALKALAQHKTWRDLSAAYGLN